MDTLFEIDDGDVLQGWADASGRRRRGAQRQSGSAVAGMRFAFYGRTSTAELQDPVTSRAWQREMAESVISGCGVITSEFFDVGCSRRVPWPRRPRAAALLERAQGVDRGFDAVVVGENPHLAGGSKETAAKAAQILRSRTAARPAPREAKTAHR